MALAKDYASVMSRKGEIMKKALAWISPPLRAAPSPLTTRR